MTVETLEFNEATEAFDFLRELEEYLFPLRKDPRCFSCLRSRA